MQSRNLILGIHGLANKPPREEKQKWWKAAIAEGLRRNCAVDEPDLPFEFVYWADIRYDAPVSEDDNLEPYYFDEGSGPFPTPDQEAGEPDRLSLTDRLYRKIEWLQEKTGLTPVDDAIIEYRLDDLWGYLEDPTFRRDARARLRDAIRAHAGSCLLLVAHSMGSLIAYDVMRMLERERAEFCVDHFVTLGAPLGLSDVRMKMEAEHGGLRVPDSVKRWSNLMDRGDVATFGEDIADAYAPNARGVRAQDVPVVNAYRRPQGDANHHKSYGYLRTPEFSQAVVDFLKREGMPARRDSEAQAAAG